MTRINPNQPRFSGLARLSRAAIAFAAAVLIAGCGTSKVETDPTIGWTAERLYQDARAEISAGNWNEARTRLEAVEARYPFGGYAQQSLIDQAYVNWKDDEPEQALAAIDRFQQQYPNHPGTDYMLYLKGLITFTPPSASFTNITRQNPSERDPKGLRESYDSFNELINRYPDSRYTADAKKRVTWLVNTIAENEVLVAQYYYERGAYVAAVNRAQTVITDFQGVPASEKALYLMYLSYDKLQLDDLRDDAKRVLDQNYPNSKYYQQGLSEPGGSLWNPINWF
ncbi:outer membrane protein assembly factor BamD [Pusillimonas sp. SM2304]|uniref:outer membrane protein assembly factor BamD n=1 Tax=Pusillimonas sp. SM2304 TaxID=3073241 RepID=UPI002877107C|nr:outer membrane protein assembly factor BamD [Pusillimonas sp. SM2304]MDS1142135.1 outer membrane protein assembly factor BamD [Pusillimonas sp. SM2304]